MAIAWNDPAFVPVADFRNATQAQLADPDWVQQQNMYKWYSPTLNGTRTNSVIQGHSDAGSWLTPSLKAAALAAAGIGGGIALSGLDTAGGGFVADGGGMGTGGGLGGSGAAATTGGTSAMGGIGASTSGVTAGSLAGAAPAGTGVAGGLTGASGTALGSGGLGTAIGAGSTAAGGIAPGLVSGMTTGPAATGALTTGGSQLGSVLGNALTPSTALGGASIGGLVGQAALDLITGNQQKQNANDAAKMSDPFASQRPQYQAQLQGLMQNPNSFANDPYYKFALDQGEQALLRNQSKIGNLGSGNLGYELTKYGQGAAYSGLNDQKNFLARLSGAEIGSPAAAGQQFLTGQNQGLAQQYQAGGSLGTLAKGLGNYVQGSLV